MNPIDRVIVISQLLILGAWEALGVLAFGWSPLVIAAVWFVGLWTYNVLTATAVRTYFKLTTVPPALDNVVNIDEARITEDDHVG